MIIKIDDLYIDSSSNNKYLKLDNLIWDLTNNTYDVIMEVASSEQNPDRQKLQSRNNRNKR